MLWVRCCLVRTPSRHVPLTRELCFFTYFTGTPGRVGDMINRRALRVEAIKMFVLDEADEMLSRGFTEQIYEIFRFLPPNTQVVLLSATMPADVLEVTQKFMRDPVRILVKRDELTLEGIKQYYIQCDQEGELLLGLILIRFCVADFLCLPPLQSGNWTRCATCTRRSRSHRLSSSATCAAASTCSPRRWRSATSPSPPCTERWTSRSARPL